MCEPISSYNMASEKNGKTNAAVSQHWQPQPGMRLQDAPEDMGDSPQVETQLICQSLFPAELPSGPDSGVTDFQAWKGP